MREPKEERRAGRVRIGLSGWTYDPWRGPFYPPKLARRRWLEHASGVFDTLEINGSFYSLQRPESYRRWRARTPRGFVFALKGSRFITHNKKLGDVDAALANFFASGVLALEEKLGPIVWQLSEKLRFAPEREDAFLAALPRDTEAALVLARRHGVAIVVSDAGGWPLVEELTAGFVYLRLHGSPHTYASLYGEQRLERWRARIQAWSQGSEPPDPRRISALTPPRRGRRDVYVYVYFDNDQHAHAPRDARMLTELMTTRPSAARSPR